MSGAKQSNPKDGLGITKVPSSPVSQLVMMEVGVAMLEGATKYGRANWRFAGARASVYYDATRRHIDAWWEGQDIDPDSNLSHITKAISSLMVLRDAMIQGKLEDDRPMTHVDVGSFILTLNESTKGVLAKAPAVAPVHYLQTTHGDIE